MAAEGKRRWLRQERNKNDFNNDLPALIFVSGAIQALFNASPMASIIGGPSPQVVVRLRPIVTSIFDVTIGRNINIDKNSRLCMVRVQIGAERQQYASNVTAALALTSGVSQATISRR